MTGCKDCTDGWIEVDKDGVRGVMACPCKKDPTKVYSAVLSKAGIPIRYTQTLDEISPKDFQVQAYKALVKLAKKPEGKGALFSGPSGTGKTKLATGFAISVMKEKQVPCIFVNIPELLNQIKATFNPIAGVYTVENEARIVLPLKRVKVLVMDDLGFNPFTEWVRDTMYSILNHRYNENLLTLVTTNYGDDDEKVKNRLEGRIGEGLRSRLHELCTPYRLEGPDLRQQELK